MVSFSCEQCGDVITKKGLDKHRNQCRGASFTCLDCMQHFRGTEYRSHTTCISEAQKYQGSLYREKDKKSKSEKRITFADQQNSGDMVARHAYVEDAPEGDDSQVVAVVDVPPKAPTPPPQSEAIGELPDSVNVFDFLVTEDKTNGGTSQEQPSNEQRMVEHPVHYGADDYAQWSQFSQPNGSHLMQHGFAYGNTPIPSSFSRYDSWHNLADSQEFVTPMPKEQRRERREKHVSISEGSEKKRKRQQVEELDLTSAKRPPSRDLTMTDAPPSDGRVLHSGLTGGLSKLVTDPDFYDDRIDAGPTPVLSPIKRTRRDGALSKADRRMTSYAEYDTITIKPSDDKHPPPTKAEKSRDRSKKYHSDERGYENRDRRHRRSRSLERSTYHDDRHRYRHRSPDRTTRASRTTYKYHDDRLPRNNTTTSTTATTGQLQSSRRFRDSISSSDRDRPERKNLRAIEYHPERERPSSVQPTAQNSIVIRHTTRADLFLSFVTKGPDSERGCSINKVLKRYHRERDLVREGSSGDDDKELWKALRVRKNERGEVVLFIGED